MPPYLYWPDDPWEVVITSSASKHGVYQADIGYLISLPRSEVDAEGNPLTTMFGSAAEKWLPALPSPAGAFPTA